MRQLSLALLGALALGFSGMALAAQAPTSAQQIAAAVLPLPSVLRRGATVVRISADGQVETMRRGTNPMVCFADLPGDSLFDVRCYHKTFVVLLDHVRGLRRAGTPESRIDSLIARGVRAGTLTLPATPTAGYRMLGPIAGYNPAAVTVTAAIDRWQSVHMPYATAAAVGVSETEGGTDPYMMAAGTWWAHVMIMDRPLRY